MIRRLLLVALLSLSFALTASADSHRAASSLERTNMPSWVSEHPFVFHTYDFGDPAGEIVCNDEAFRVAIVLIYSVDYLDQGACVGYWRP